jgi:hypothetical protein
LDGINAGEGSIRQFVATPLGEGYTVEEQLTGKSKVGGMQLRVFEPKPGKFPDKRPRRGAGRDETPVRLSSPVMDMGFGAGGRIRQKIYPDEYGIDTWDTSNFAEVFVHVVNSVQFEAITERKPPPTPIDAKTYTQYGFPWFELYDEDRGAVAGSEELSKVKGVQKTATEKGLGQPDEPVDVTPEQTRKIRVRKSRGQATGG